MAADQTEAVFLSSVTRLHCYACLVSACLVRIFVLMRMRLFAQCGCNVPRLAETEKYSSVHGTHPVEWRAKDAAPRFGLPLPQMYSPLYVGMVYLQYKVQDVSKVR